VRRIKGGRKSKKKTWIETLKKFRYKFDRNLDKNLKKIQEI
jgi:hypothetical protein